MFNTCYYYVLEDVIVNGRHRMELWSLANIQTSVMPVL